MTDRHAGYLITLEEDVRSDDAESIINALRMVKGVLHVEPIVSRSSGKVVRYCKTCKNTLARERRRTTT